MLLEDRGEFTEARRCAARALAIGERLPDPRAARNASLRLGALAFFTGDWAQARERFERADALPERSPLLDAMPLLERGRLALAEGEWQQAARDLEECSAITLGLGDGIVHRAAESLLAERDLLEGRPAAALVRLLPLRDRDGMEERMVTTFVLPVLAWSYLELTEVARATQTIDAALRRARRGKYRLALVGILRVRALVAGHAGRWEEAECCLEEGVALARSMPYPHGEGRLLHVDGLLHAQRGHAERARECLCEAVAIFRQLGAARDRQQAEEVLATLQLPRSTAGRLDDRVTPAGYGPPRGT
jgi:hypothetical protein